MKINVYVPDAMHAEMKELELENVSATCQAAIQREINRVRQVRQSVSWLMEHDPETVRHINIVVQGLSPLIPGAVRRNWRPHLTNGWYSTPRKVQA